MTISIKKTMTMTTLVVFCVVLFSFLAEGDPNTNVVGQICTNRHYRGYDGYNICLYNVTNAVVAGTAKHDYSYSFESSWSNGLSGKCYGHAACKGDISPDDCTSCLEAAWTHTADYCTTSVGAQTKLKDCRIRYEDHPFDPDY